MLETAETIDLWIADGNQQVEDSIPSAVTSAVAHVPIPELTPECCAAASGPIASHKISAEIDFTKNSLQRASRRMKRITSGWPTIRPVS
jgi:hypothetical protein